MRIPPKLSILDWDFREINHPAIRMTISKQHENSPLPGWSYEPRRLLQASAGWSLGLQAQVPGPAAICSKAWPESEGIRPDQRWAHEADGAWWSMMRLRIGPWPGCHAPHGEGRLRILGCTMLHPYELRRLTLFAKRFLTEAIKGTCSARPLLVTSLLISRWT